MNMLDVYVARQIARPLVIALLVAVLVLLLERMLRLLDLILGAEGPLGLFVELIAYLVPEYAGLALPMSLLLGVMLGFNQLSRDGEVDAFQASGLGLARQARAAVILGVCIAVITGTIVGYAKPFARYAYQAVVYTMTDAAFHFLLRPNLFAEVGSTTVFIQGIRPESGTFVNVFLYESRGDGGSTVITARDGAMSRGADGMPMLRLFDGVRLSTDPTSTARRDAAQQTTTGVLRFAEMRTMLTEETAGLFRARGGDRREFTLGELWAMRDAPPAGMRPTDIISELHVRIVQTLSVLVLPFLAIPFALGRRRSDRIYGITAGLLVLVGYNQLLDFGKNLVQDGSLGVGVALWLPFALLVTGSLWSFWRAAERVPRSVSPGVLGWLAARIEALSAWLRAHGRRSA
jgi:lipopolysaccharide export system permease protein